MLKCDGAYMTDNRAAEAAVKTLVLQNEVAKLTLDAIEEAVLRIDRNGDITYLNRKAEILTGWQRKEALGRPIVDVLRITGGGSTSPVGKPLISLEGGLGAT